MKTPQEWRAEIPFLQNLKWTPETIDEWIKKVQNDALRSAANMLGNKAKKTYVGDYNPIQEGVRRGLYDAEIALLELVIKKGDYPLTTLNRH